MSDRFDHRLERKPDSRPDEAEGTSVRRLELITGTGRRRQWSSDDKARIVVESLKPGVTISEVARRNGVSPQQLFAWRRVARALFDDVPGPSGMGVVPGAPRPRGRPRKDRGESQRSGGAPAFAPVVVTALAAPTAAAARPTPPTPALPLPAVAPLPGTIEIAIGDATVRIGGEVEEALIAAVLGALRRAS